MVVQSPGQANPRGLLSGSCFLASLSEPPLAQVLPELPEGARGAASGSGWHPGSCLPGVRGHVQAAGKATAHMVRLAQHASALCQGKHRERSPQSVSSTAPFVTRVSRKKPIFRESCRQVAQRTRYIKHKVHLENKTTTEKGEFSNSPIVCIKRNHVIFEIQSSERSF